MEEYICLLRGIVACSFMAACSAIILAASHYLLIADLSRKIMRGIALALGGPPDAFEREKAGDSFWVMRLIGYPISSDIPEIQRSDTGW